MRGVGALVLALFRERVELQKKLRDKAFKTS